MPLTSTLRHLAGEAALQMIMDGEARVAASAGHIGVSGRTAAPPDPQRDPDAGTSDSLLARAAKGLILIDEHYRQLEAYARDREAWADAEVLRLDGEAKLWEQAGAEAERQIEDFALRTRLMEQRAETADQVAKQHRATLLSLQKQIAAAFGTGSDTSRMMAALGFAEAT